MKDYVKAFDDLPWLVKLLLCLPILDLLWAVYRIVKGAKQKNTLMLIAGILWIVPGSVVCWLADFVCTIISKKPTLLA